MPNVTISVTDELKAEMDKFLEVSWSEICRKAIARYINERENPTPRLELDIRAVRLDTNHESGYPTLTADLRIHNKMGSDIIVDRILSNVKFSSSGHVYHIGSSFDLNRRAILSNYVGVAQLFLPLFKEKIESLKGKFESTFSCLIDCIIIVNGFRDTFKQNVMTEIPIDKWKRFVGEEPKKYRRADR